MKKEEFIELISKRFINGEPSAEDVAFLEDLYGKTMSNLAIGFTVDSLHPLMPPSEKAKRIQEYVDSIYTALRCGVELYSTFNVKENQCGDIVIEGCYSSNLEWLRVNKNTENIALKERKSAVYDNVVSRVLALYRT